jgi:uncharacterized protein
MTKKTKKTKKTTKTAKSKKTAGKNLCEGCGGRCCRYIAFPIDAPENRKDYDDIRWYLCHENINVFLEEGQWYVSVMSDCRHLDNDSGKCGIYEERPKICRQFDPTGCEYRCDEYGYDLHFTNDKEMADYIRIKFDNNVIPKKK